MRCWEIYPGGLIQIYRIINSFLRNEKTLEIWNNEVNNHNKIVAYNKPHNDPYLSSRQAEERFNKLRQDYWDKRLNEEGKCSGIMDCLAQSNDYVRYFDYHETVYHYEVDYSK